MKPITLIDGRIISKYEVIKKSTYKNVMIVLVDGVPEVAWQKTPTEPVTLMTVRVTKPNGRVLKFESIQACADAMHVAPTTITGYLNQGHVVKSGSICAGCLFERLK